MDIVANIPLELIALPQWVLWRYEDRGGPKPTKVPITCMGYKASVTNPEHWSSFEDVLKFAARPGFCDGYGYVFVADDPYSGIDLDNVWQSDADEGAPWAMEILERFADTYMEASPSDCGMKIWCRAKAPRCGSWPIGAGAIEIYDHARFFTVTGRSNGVRIITDHQADINSLVEYLGGARPSASPAGISGTIAYGTQHNTLVSLAGTMWRRGMSSEAIEAALQVVNAQQCEKPGPPENIRKIVESMQRYPR
jgi:primase-polymerase (primpol)-like protein